MKDLQLVENQNNLEFINKDLYLNTDLSRYVSQKLRIRLLFFRGEWYLNINKGIPYHTEILGVKNPNLSYIEDLMISEINTCPGVSELLSFELTTDTATRELFINFTAKLENGDIIAISL